MPLMKISFTKMHGCGNDFIMIEDMSAAIELTTAQVELLCDRHFGIGADGVILVRPPVNSENAAYMYYINSDGSLAGMCGNGIRCFTRFLVDRKLVDGNQHTLTVETLSGSKAIVFHPDDQGQVSMVTVDMGEPGFTPQLIPTMLSANATVTTGRAEHPAVIEAPIETPQGTLLFTLVNMGNPHAVCFLTDEQSHLFDLSDSEFAALGEPLEKHRFFPEKSNIEFALPILSAHSGETNRSESLTEVRMRVFERGCGETLACGTGACATAVAAAITGRAGYNSRVHLRGGFLDVFWNEFDHVMMTGSATVVFEGQIDL
jgi:diaminopimelate epimerase